MTNESLALVKEGVVDKVARRVTEMTAAGELELPRDYAPGNAMSAAWLVLQETQDRDKRPVLESCSKPSIANALLSMVVQGLTPARNQVYFIAYGNRLVAQRSYFGDVAVLKRIFGRETEVRAEVVYAGDTLEYEIERGRKRITKHTQKLADVDNDKIVAAYAVVRLPGGEEHAEIMPMEKLRRSWEQGQTKGKSPAHTGFPDEMAKRTVTRRLVKMLINAADDSHLVRAARGQDVDIAEAEVEAAEAAEVDEGEVIDLDRSDGPDQPEASGNGAAGDAAPARAEEQPEQAATPTERFKALIAELELDPSTARRVAAQQAGLDDVRKLGNTELGEVLSDAGAFMAAYDAASEGGAASSAAEPPEPGSDQDEIGW